jgi:hypothetical protein
MPALKIRNGRISGVNVRGFVRGVGHQGAHVGMARDSGPMPGKDSPAVGVLLALPHNAHTGALEPEVEAADPREQASDEHVTRSP